MKYKYLQIYFYLILLISISITLFGNKKIDAYGVVILIFTTFPVFFILYKISLNQFSDEIEMKHPDLFDKYKMRFGLVKRINEFEIFNNSDFDKIEDKAIIARLKLTKQLLGLVLKSFILIIILGISLIIFKR